MNPIEEAFSKLKALLRKAFSVGYTGVAEIEGQRTDYWLVDQISSVF